MQKPDILYKAADYLRLSKEDGDFSISPGKQESNSISSQRDLIKRFVENDPDIELAAEFCDDGYTGTNFDRPDFQKMMEAVRRGEINCIIVKDLSRFGRDYIESGKYIEKIFPQLGVRFIAINDHYDSLNAVGGSDSIILPFKNLINDSYSRDISIKVRSNLESKRRRGEFIANFPVYGYIRSPEDKTRLIVDESAASTVRDIFRWKIEGLSAGKISDKLNARGTQPPMEHKKNSGSKYASCFKTTSGVKWSAVAVIRILTNEVYTGNLVQGRRTTPNYKVKKVVVKDASEWIRTERAHEAIISMAEFNLVQKLMEKEGRSAPGAEGVHPLSGMVVCGSCGLPAKRTSVVSKGKKYVYYNCPQSFSRSKHNRPDTQDIPALTVCPSCSITETELEAAVLATLQAQIGLILDLENTLAQVDTLAWEKRELKRLDAEIVVQQEIIEKNNAFKVGIYEDLRDGLLSKDEFHNLKSQFSERIQTAEDAITSLKREYSVVKEGLDGQHGWLAQFHLYQNITGLDRALIVNLVEKITLYPGREINVQLRHQDQFSDIIEFLVDQGLFPPGETEKTDKATDEAEDKNVDEPADAPAGETMGESVTAVKEAV